jgi:hypothetical protein
MPLEITTNLPCPVNCRHCPQAVLASHYRGPRHMSMATFLICLSKVPPEVRIDFSGMSELWVNPRCGEMLRLAVRLGHPVSMYSTLVGMRLADVDLLETIEFEDLVIHVPDTEGNSPIAVTAEYLALLEAVVGSEVHAQRRFAISCHGFLHPEVEPIVTSLPVVSNMIDRAGNLSLGERADRFGESDLHCSVTGRGLDCNVLLPSGEVLLCCMDYAAQHVLGNLLGQSYESILKGEALERIRQALTSGRERVLCHSCSLVATEGNA